MADMTPENPHAEGLAVFTMGFRPFFLMGSLWAVAAMALWLMSLSGALALPTVFDPVSWHSHELLFGYLSAILAGFLLTAVPSWTGRPALTGGTLASLAMLWVVGRVAVVMSEMLPAGLVAVVDLAFPICLVGFVLREITTAGNWRNLIIVAMMIAFIVGNALFHYEAAQGVYAAQGYGARLGLAAAIMMVAVVGGRITPAFTRNWLSQQGSPVIPAPPMQTFDKVSLLVLLIALVSWVWGPEHPIVGGLLVGAGGLHLARLSRWAGHRTLRQPLVAVLHLAYLFLPLGAVALGVSILAPGLIGPADAQHFWMAGAIGLMTLAVMTRATLGHSGRALHANAGTLVIFAAIVVAVAARLFAGIAPTLMYTVSGAAWMTAFGGFALIYGPMLLGRKITNT